MTPKPTTVAEAVIVLAAIARAIESYAEGSSISGAWEGCTQRSTVSFFVNELGEFGRCTGLLVHLIAGDRHQSTADGAPVNGLHCEVENLSLVSLRSDAMLYPVNPEYAFIRVSHTGGITDTSHSLIALLTAAQMIAASRWGDSVGSRLKNATDLIIRAMQC